MSCTCKFLNNYFGATVVEACNASTRIPLYEDCNGVIHNNAVCTSPFTGYTRSANEGTYNYHANGTYQGNYVCTAADTIAKTAMYSFAVPIIVEILAEKKPINARAAVVIEIVPAETPQQQNSKTYKFTVNTLPIVLNISDPLIHTANQFLDNILDAYIDEDRKLKTLLNYGEDRQSVALGYRYAGFDTNGINRLQLKLLQPVPTDIGINSQVFLSREVAKSVIDKVRVRFAPSIDTTPYLRPKNLSVAADLDSGKSLKNITLQRLALQSGSVGVLDQYTNKTFEDEIFRQWYSYDFNSVELNIDFTDYNNFVFYGSAAMRLAAFKQKLISIESLELQRRQFISSSTYTATTSSAGYVFVQEKTAEFSKKKEDIIRAFDRYEQYLYFTPSGSNKPYIAGAYYVDGGYEFNSMSYWPKNTLNEPLPVYDAISEEWYNSQLEIAQRFDEFNVNNLVNTIPTHVREHDENDSYITFVTMIGHLFDTIKPYVDQFPYIWSRNLNPNEEISKDLVNEIAEAVGFKLPTLNSTYELTDNILGTTSTPPRRELTAEIYKRLLHNLGFFAKAKGTKTALEAFIKTFGITPQIISVKETGTPVTSSYYTFDEFSTGLDFDINKSSYIRLPISASGRAPKTLQFNCTVGKVANMTILTGDDKWALNVKVHPSSSDVGRFEITSGSANTVLLSSSYYEIFGDELLNIAIQADATASLFATQVDGEDIIFRSIDKNSIFTSLWNSTQYVYIGGAGPRVINGYEGTLDELRLWKDSLSEETIYNSVYDPASNAGDTYTDAAEKLLVQLSFSNINSASIEVSSSIPNESPYKDIAVSPSLETLFVFNVSGSDFSRYNRTIRHEMISAGSSGYVTSKVKIAPPAVFIDKNSEIKTLHRTKSIVEPQTKRVQRGRNKVVVSVSPTEIVNQNIIRSFGMENINSVLGSPTTLYTLFDKSLSKLKSYYQRYYYVDVNTNRFIRILSEMGSILDQVVDYFIPSKATLIKGVVIEPNILEQVKIPPIKDLRFYGKNSRRTRNAANSLTGSNSDYGATFNVSNNIEVYETNKILGSYTTFQAQESFNITEISANTTKLNAGLKSEVNLSSSYLPVNATLDMLSNTVLSSTDQREIIPQYTTKIYPTLQEITGSVPSYNTLLNAVKNINTLFTSSLQTINVNLTSSLLPMVVGKSAFYTSSVAVNETDVAGQNSTYILQHELWNYSGPTRVSRINVGLDNLNKIDYNVSNYGSAGSEPYNRLYTRKLFVEEITTPRKGGITSTYIPALYDIPPVADFRDFGVYTYFNDVNGIYYFPETIKTPAYQRPLNQTWNEVSQSFEDARTWTRGGRYNIYDVVYQDITDDNIKNIQGLTMKDVNAGNKRYYVFKSRASYRPSDDGSPVYSGSVPSYTPPSLDRDNWELLRFIPTQKRVPKRVVFDTFTIPTPDLNNFKTTTVSLDRILDIPDRYIDTFSIPSIEPNSFVRGELSVQNIAILFAFQSNTSGLRIRLYRTPEARDADLNRLITQRPQGSHGVLLDAPITSVNTVELANPIPTLVAGTEPPAGKIYYIINNDTSTVKLGINLILYYFAIQIQPRIPFGYLRKHYRFFRDNSTATKRRNYYGCKNTQATTIDGLPSVQVFLSEGTDLIISPTQTNEEIITGGGGQLNVT